MCQAVPSKREVATASNSNSTLRMQHLHLHITILGSAQERKLIHSVSETPQVFCVHVFYVYICRRENKSSIKSINFWCPGLMSLYLRKQSNFTQVKKCHGFVSARKLKRNCLREVREEQKFLIVIVMPKE